VGFLKLLQCFAVIACLPAGLAGFWESVAHTAHCCIVTKVLQKAGLKMHHLQSSSQSVAVGEL